MYYGFQTEREEVGVAALLVYGVYQSRDRGRFKPTVDMWGRIASAVKNAARRARRTAASQAAPGAALNNFVDRLQPKLSCRAVQPRYMTGHNRLTTGLVLETGEVIEVREEGRRTFWTEILEDIDAGPVMRALTQETALVVAHVRDRIEREKALQERGFLDEPDEETIELIGDADA